ncbi:MAG: exosortase C-terminal domain/associated protein EpsI [bacterium]
MPISNKRFIIAFILLSFTAIITYGSYSLRNYSDELYTPKIPLIIGNWYGKELGMDERTYKILETKDAIMREYINSNDTVLLAIVFSQDNRKVAHPPEVCFAGGGWERSDRGIETLIINGREIKMNRLILQKDSWKQVVLYLYKSGDKLTENYYAQQFNIILNGMLSKDTSSALIRVSANVYDGDVSEKIALTKNFFREIIPIIEQKLP